MKENKKKIEKVEVFDQNAIESDVTKEENKNIEKTSSLKKEKKKNVLWAQILVVVLLIAVVGLGLYKLVDYLNKPKTLFYSVIESAYSDFASIANRAKDDPYNKLLNSGGLEINSDIKMTFSDLPSDFADMGAILNSLTYKIDVKIDKNNNYSNTSMQIGNGTANILNIMLVDENYKSYIKIPELFSRFIELDSLSINLDAFDLEKNVYIGDIIKYELLNMLDDERFVSSTEAIAINGKTVDCKKSTYAFTGKEVSTFIDNVITSIKNNSNAYYYLADLYGVNASEVDVKLQDLKDNLNIKEDAQYVLSAYTKATTDEAVKLELNFTTTIEEETAEVSLAYIKDLDYKAIEYTENDETNMFEIKGDLDKSAELVLRDSASTITATMVKSEDTTSGTIKVVTLENKETQLEGAYSTTVTKESSTTYKTSSVVDFTVYQNDEKMSVKFESSSLVNGNVKVDKVDISDSIKLDELTEEDTNTIFSNLMAVIINLYPVYETESPVIDGSISYN